MTVLPKQRPRGIAALSIFFTLGAVISLTATISLIFPDGFLEPIWRLNPHARKGFEIIGGWAILLLLTVCSSCSAAAIGLWRGSRWGYRVAFTMITINLVGDIANTILGTEPRALIGVPIAAAILWYLASKRVRLFFCGATSVRGSTAL